MASKRTFRFRSFRLDAAVRRWSFAPHGFEAMTIEGATAVIEVNGRPCPLDRADSFRCVDAGRRRDELGERRVFRVEAAFARPALGWTLDFEVDVRGRHLIIQSRLENRSGASLTLGGWDLIAVDRRTGGRIPLGPDHARATFMHFRPWDAYVERLASEGGEHVSTTLCHLYNPACGAVFSSAFITVDRIRCEHLVRYSRRHGLTSYRARCAFRLHELPAGGSIESERLMVEPGRDPFGALEKWAETVQRIYRPRLNPKTTVGWLGWSWVDGMSEREQPFEQIVQGNAEAIRRRLAGFDVDYVWMSQVNLKDMVPGNWLEFNDKHFPHGFEETLRRLRALKFKPGLWIAPFWIFGNARVAMAENRDHLVRRRDGSPLVSKIAWDFIETQDPQREKFDLYYLDGSHPGARAWMRKVFRAYRRLGIRYYMLDFLGCGLERSVYDKSMTWSHADRLLMEEIRRAAGPDTHLLSAVNSTPAFVGCVDAARVNTDYGEGRPLYPPYHCLYNATFAVKDKYFGNCRRFLQNAASSYFTHRRLYINDCNVMTVDKPVPRPTAEITATVFGLTGSPIMLGDDIRGIHEERLALIKKCLPCADRMAVPVDLFERVRPDDYSRVLALPVKTAWDNYLLAAVFNLDDEPFSTSLPMAQLGLKPAASYWAYDFWNEEYLGAVRGELACSVPPGSCRLLRLTRARALPWLLSTVMHVQQGNVEVPSVRWDAVRMALTGTATRPVGEAGNLLFLMPPGWRLVNHEGHWLMKDGRDMSVVIRRPVTLTRRVMPWELRFERLSYTTAY